MRMRNPFGPDKRPVRGDNPMSYSVDVSRDCVLDAELKSAMNGLATTCRQKTVDLTYKRATFAIYSLRIHTLYNCHPHSAFQKVRSMSPASDVQPTHVEHKSNP